MNIDDEQETDEKEKTWQFHLLLAFQFLTILPISLPRKAEESDFGKSTSFFPVVGLAQGLILLFIYKLFSLVLPEPVVNVLVLLSLVILAGGLHVDGFCDTVDGLAGRRGRDEALHIMKDSSVGAFTSVGVMLLFLMKYAGLISLPVGHRSGVIVAMPVFSLWSMVLLARLHHYARVEGGTGKAFVEHTGNRELATASLITLVVTLVAMSYIGLLVYFLIFMVTLFMGEYFRQRLGGVTGDALGAAKEVNDALVLLFTLIFLPQIR